MKTTNIQRTYKDSLFRMIFREKKELLSLYNALNNSEYQNADELTINTVESILYMGMKNDVSFLIEESLNLYEAQSTWNPNMPLRGLFYFSHIYEGYIAEHELNIYSKTLLKLQKWFLQNVLCAVLTKYIVDLKKILPIQKTTHFFLTTFMEKIKLIQKLPVCKFILRVSICA